jgi:hypothetical protein
MCRTPFGCALSLSAVLAILCIWQTSPSVKGLDDFDSLSPPIWPRNISSSYGSLVAMQDCSRSDSKQKGSSPDCYTKYEHLYSGTGWMPEIAISYKRVQHPA